jgi:hypothetical protein
MPRVDKDLKIAVIAFTLFEAWAIRGLFIVALLALKIPFPNDFLFNVTTWALSFFVAYLVARHLFYRRSGNFEQKLKLAAIVLLISAVVFGWFSESVMDHWFRTNRPVGF